MTAFLAPLPERSVLSVRGPEAQPFLQGLISNDMRKATASRAIYAALLTPQGKFLHDFFVLGANGSYLLDTLTERADDLKRRLSFYRLRAKVEIAPAPERVFALWGEAGAPAIAGAFQDPRLPELGWRILSHERPAVYASDAGAQDYAVHRLALGVPDSRDLIPEDTFLLDADFEELNGVDFKKGCYVGQEITARMKHRGSARKRMLPVAVDGPLPAPGTPILADGKAVGTLLTGADGRAMAVLRLDRLAEAESAGQLLTAEMSRVRAIRPAWLQESL